MHPGAAWRQRKLKEEEWPPSTPRDCGQHRKTVCHSCINKHETSSTPNCLDCAPVNKVDRQLPVSPGRKSPPPLPALLSCLSRVQSTGSCRVGLPPSMAPARPPAPFCFLGTQQHSHLGHGASAHKQTRPEAVAGWMLASIALGRWDWQPTSWSRPQTGQSSASTMCEGLGGWGRPHAASLGLESTLTPQVTSTCHLRFRSFLCGLHRLRVSTFSCAFLTVAFRGQC